MSELLLFSRQNKVQLTRKLIPINFREEAAWSACQDCPASLFCEFYSKVTITLYIIKTDAPRKQYRLFTEEEELAVLGRSFWQSSDKTRL